jgi:hypothetical protein
MPINAEITRVNSLSRAMLEAYVAWGHQFEYGETYNTMYGNLIDFVNFRMETANSCLCLLDNEQVADALGLCRSLLEHYLLFILMCRGNQYFQLQDLSGKSASEFRERLKSQVASWEKEVADGKTNCIAVREYGHTKRHIMFVYEGLQNEDEHDFKIPLHFFQFQEFRPETMRLDSADYFEYYERDPKLKKALKGHRAEARHRYQHYLSYDALLECLELNDIANSSVQTRIEAHYTFLGRYLHPTHDAARDLYERSNMHAGKPHIGMDGRYSSTARLLASAYVAHLISGILEEMCTLFEGAPARFVTSPATTDLRALTSGVASTTGYFWFIFNDAPLYDRFNWAVYHTDDGELASFGGYSGIPTEKIQFNQHVVSSLEHGLQGWNNQRVGTYTPPI